MKAFGVVAVDVDMRDPAVFLHRTDGHAMGLHPADRVVVQAATGRVHAAVVLAGELVEPGTVAVPRSLLGDLGGATEATVEIHPPGRVRELMRRKLDGQRLSDKDVADVMRAIQDGRASEIEMTLWVCGLHLHGLDEQETAACIEAMVAGGTTIDFGRSPVMDVHSIGGVPGNKYAPLAVSIVAAEGLLIPKTSSRAISSACGTADFMEVLAPVAFTARDLREIVLKTGGCLAWGGGIDLAPADDRLIRIEHPLAVDPPAQLLASVLSKKKAVGATHALIDIPVGAGAKLPDEAAGEDLARRFVAMGRRIGVRVSCLLSPGDQPLGRTIGPALEAREVLEALADGKRPSDLVEKACTLAGRLLELGGKAPRGKGMTRAQECLASGRAQGKFQEILEAQGGDPDVRPESLSIGEHHDVVRSTRSGVVTGFDIRGLVAVARAAGSPLRKGAGIVLHRVAGDAVSEGDPVLEVYAQADERLDHALDVARAVGVVRVADRHPLGFVE